MGKAGFRVESVQLRPMSLLRLRRTLEDEGLLGAVRFAKNIVTDKEARDRVLVMRTIFERYRENLRAVAIVARKVSSLNSASDCS